MVQGESGKTYGTDVKRRDEDVLEDLSGKKREGESERVGVNVSVLNRAKEENNKKSGFLGKKEKRERSPSSILHLFRVTT